MNYPQVVSENTYTKDSKNLLDLEITTAPGTTTEVVKFCNKKKLVRVAGFRPGKVPKHLMEQAVGKEQLYLDRMVQEFNTVREERDFITAANPDLVNWTESPDGSLNFKITVEIVPAFTVEKSDYIGLEVEKDEVDPGVIETRWGRYVESLQKQFGTKKPVDGPAQEDHYVTLTLTNDAAISELNIEPRQIQLNDRFVLNEVKEHLLGMTDGETKAFTVSFPEEFRIVGLRNKTIGFEAKLENIKELIVHEVGDELAKKTNTADSLETLKQKFSETETSAEIERINHLFELECMETLLKKINLAIPQSLVNSEMESILRNRLKNIEDMGLPREYAFKNIDYAVLNAQAKNRLAAAIVFNQLLKQKEFSIDDITPEDLMKEFAKRAEHSENTAEELAAKYTMDDLTTLKKELLYNRFVDDLVAQAKPVPRKPNNAEDQP